MRRKGLESLKTAGKWHRRRESFEPELRERVTLATERLRARFGA